MRLKSFILIWFLKIKKIQKKNLFFVHLIVNKILILSNESHK